VGLTLRTRPGLLPPKLQRALNPLIAALGAEGMAGVLAASVNCIARADRVYAFERRPESKPVLYTSWAKAGEIEEIVSDYRERYYKTDPMNAVIAQAGNRDPMALLRLRREDVPDTDYRRTCFEEPEICERATILCRTDGGWLVLNLGRTYRSGYFRPEELRDIASFAELALPLLARHDQLVRAQHEFGAKPPDLMDLEHRFEKRFPALTVRERQVCARTMIGMTAEAIALDLGIGRASVLTYRQRSYKRLGICSAYQLSALVLH
jgi:DNA-binding CsgD family transcriptional regulator